jgi:hypothetical protein
MYTVYQTIAGSRLYNLNTPKSDEDYRGVFMVDQKTFFCDKPEQFSVKDKDDTFYELTRAVQLLLNNNPSMIEMLFVPADKIITLQPEFKTILDNRALFVSKTCYASFSGYAYSQISKAKGKGKVINNPMPIDKPRIENYIYCANADKNGKPRRYGGSYVGKCAKMEHTNNLYRVYAVGKEPFVKNNAIVVSPISIEDENSFSEIIFVNYDNFRQDKIKHTQYWEWIKKRNPSRWVSQERGEIDYDGKNMSHCIRLLMSCCGILEYGIPKVEFFGQERQYLLDVKYGNVPYEDVMATAEELMSRAKELNESTSLPVKPNTKAIMDMTYDIYKEYWRKEYAS